MSQQPLLQPVPSAAEAEKVNAIFAGVEKSFGHIPDGLRLYGLSPTLLENFLANVGYFMGHKRLSQPLLSMIRYLGSARVNCTFCINMNEGFLMQMGADINQVRASRNDIEKAPVSSEELTLLRLAMKGVATPDEVNESDIAAARAAGWNDHDIFEVVAIAAQNLAFTTLLKTFKVEHQGAYA